MIPTKTKRISRFTTLEARSRLDRTAARRLRTALALSAVLHAAVILGVHFKAPDLRPEKIGNTLEVVLVNSKSRQKPNEATALAQANVDGGGNTEKDRSAKSPLPLVEPTPPSELNPLGSRESSVEEGAVVELNPTPAPPEVKEPPKEPAPPTKPKSQSTEHRGRSQTPVARLEPQDRSEKHAAQVGEHAKSDQRVVELEKQARELMTRLQTEKKVATGSTPPARLESPPPPVGTAAEHSRPARTIDLIASSMRIARLEAQIEKDYDTYQKRPRRRFIGPATNEYRFARYREEWRGKVERIGNLNYPEEAKERNLHGSLQLTVAVSRDGRVEDVQVNRSSGHKILDAAAIRIVQLAAPFAVFPEDLGRDTDILYITNTWTFTRSDQLQSE